MTEHEEKLYNDRWWRTRIAKSIVASTLSTAIVIGGPSVVMATEVDAPDNGGDGTQVSQVTEPVVTTEAPEPPTIVPEPEPAVAELQADAAPEQVAPEQAPAQAPVDDEAPAPEASPAAPDAETDTPEQTAALEEPTAPAEPVIPEQIAAPGEPTAPAEPAAEESTETPTVSEDAAPATEASAPAASDAAPSQDTTLEVNEAEATTKAPETAKPAENAVTPAAAPAVEEQNATEEPQFVPVPTVTQAAPEKVTASTPRRAPHRAPLNANTAQQQLQERINSAADGATVEGNQASVRLSGALNFNLGNRITLKGFTFTRAEGYKGELLNVSNESTLTLRDVLLLGNDDAQASMVNVSDGSTLNIVDGTKLTRNHNNAQASKCYGGAISISDSTLNMSAGEISDNVSNDGDDYGAGGGINASNSKVNISGGRISGNSARYLGGGIHAFKGSKVTIFDHALLQGNRVTDSLSASGMAGHIPNDRGFGGAVYVSGRGTTLDITGDARVDGNYAIKRGGAVFVTCEGVATLEGNAKLTNNTAGKSDEAYGGVSPRGGAVCIDRWAEMDKQYNGSYGTFIMKGGEISGNTANCGGAVAVYADPSARASDISGLFIMQGGKITGNHARNYGDSDARGGAVYIGSYLSFSQKKEYEYDYSQATFIFTGGEVDGNTCEAAATAKYNQKVFGDGVYVSPGGAFYLVAGGNDTATTGGADLLDTVYLAANDNSKVTDGDAARAEIYLLGGSKTGDPVMIDTADGDQFNGRPVVTAARGFNKGRTGEIQLSGISSVDEYLHRFDHVSRDVVIDSDELVRDQRGDWKTQGDIVLGTHQIVFDVNVPQPEHKESDVLSSTPGQIGDLQKSAVTGDDLSGEINEDRTAKVVYDASAGKKALIINYLDSQTRERIQVSQYYDTLAGRYAAAQTSYLYDSDADSPAAVNGNDLVWYQDSNGTYLGWTKYGIASDYNWQAAGVEVWKGGKKIKSKDMWSGSWDLSNIVLNQSVTINVLLNSKITPTVSYTFFDENAWSSCGSTKHSQDSASGKLDPDFDYASEIQKNSEKPGYDFSYYQISDSLGNG